MFPDKSFVGDLPTWVTAIGTLSLATLALFGDYLRDLIWKPRLVLEIHPTAPDFHKTIWMVPVERQAFFYNSLALKRQSSVVQQPIACYYFRIRVTNSGNREAKAVEIYVKSLESLEKGEFKNVDRFSPMDLLWADVRVPSLPILIPDLPRLCDLAHVLTPAARRLVEENLSDVSDNATVLALDLQIIPTSKGNLIGPGEYRLGLVVAAANAKPARYSLDIAITGDWYDEPERMFTDGIRFRLHKL